MSDEGITRAEALVAVVLDALDAAGAERAEAIPALLGALMIHAHEAGQGTPSVFAKALLSSAEGDLWAAREALDEAFLAKTAVEVVEAMLRAPEAERLAS